MIRAIIRHGVDIHARNAEGISVLIAAAGYCPVPDNIKILLEAGADAGARDAHGKTAYDYAVENPHLQGGAELQRLKMAL